MFKSLKINLGKKTLLTTLLAVVSFPSYAAKVGEQVTEILSAITNNPNQSTVVSNEGEVLSSPNSSVVLDFSENTAESWDAKNKPKNLIENCIDGTSITGFEYSNITIQTVGGSFLSEAIMYFSDSNNGDNGVLLAVGANNEISGTSSYSSNGIIDISDNDFSDVVSLGDSKFHIQFYETIDDAPDAIDARYINGILKVYGVDLTATESCSFIAGKVTTDLSVQFSASQSGTYRVGDSIEFIIEVSNNGNSVATNVMQNISLSDKLQLVDLSCDDGTNTTDITDISALSVQNIPAHSVLQCVLDTTILSAGEIETRVTVSSDNDNDLSNNSANLIIFGTVITVPVNNKLVLLLLILSLLFFSRKRFS